MGSVRTSQTPAAAEEAPASAGPESGRSRPRRTRRVGVPAVFRPPNVFILPAALFLLGTIGYAIGYNINLSLRGGGLAAFLAGEATFVGLDNYVEMLGDRRFRNALWVSLLFSVGSLVFQFVIAFAIALVFNAGFRGQSWVRTLLLVGWVLPPVVSGSLFRWLLDGTFGLINHILVSVGLTQQAIFFLSDPTLALVSVTAASIWVGVPFLTVLLLAGLRTLPREIYEAAGVDGAGYWQSLRHMTLPLMKPVSLTVLLLAAIWTFKAFDTIYIMTGGGPARATEVLPLYAYHMAFRVHDFSTGAAAAVVLMLFPLILGILYLRSARRH
ncbi:sugar ABC transporter permease [Natronosporangium hydrolyticum]|uniref:Sugar ABC transporter permease n=1 Tax=Natronosporangium hydrolyticum TaxID=2811111 RepID=A0A895YMN4_9ACTN|nr:sugar ABC transporter permease [Natronosporangium hydrolyticum]QSB15360.1 sugar ABC transporter permease [Natronosporangium hydrolyticum]